MIDTSVKNIYRVVDVKVNVPFSHKQILSCKALKFLADLHIHFNNRRLELLSLRNERQNSSYPNNNLVNSVDELRKSYNNEIAIIEPEKSYLLKHISLSDSKMFLIHLDSPNWLSWSELLETHIYLKKAIEQTLNPIESEPKEFTEVIQKEVGIILSPRDLFCEEINIHIDKQPLSCALFDVGIFLFHNAKPIAESGSNPYILLKSITNYFEAKYWSEIFLYAEEYLGLPSGSIKAFINFDERLSAFEKRHILHELKDYVMAA